MSALGWEAYTIAWKHGPRDIVPGGPITRSITVRRRIILEAAAKTFIKHEKQTHSDDRLARMYGNHQRIDRNRMYT